MRCCIHRIEILLKEIGYTVSTTYIHGVLVKTHPLYAFSSLLLSISAFMYTLSVVLGSAQALPHTQNVSMGSNPLFSFGGTISNGNSLVLTAPNDQMMVVTDVILTMNSNSCSSSVELTDSNGSVLSHFKLMSYNHLGTYRAAQSEPSSIQHSFNSGIATSPNTSLTITETGSCNVAYTLSGYYAQP